MALLSCKNVWKWYPSPDGRLEVLRGIDFELMKNDFVAIVGASGVGKSTLLHLLGLLDTPSEGDVTFEDKSVANLSDNQMAHIRVDSIGFVFQFHHLMPEFTALENLLIPQKIARSNSAGAKERAMYLLDSLGIADRAKHFPGQLSGGEQQRIALARALINEPKIILADEPTGNLDSDNAQKFMDIVGTMRERNNIAVVLATHNLQVAKFAEGILRLRNGKLSPEKML